MVELNVNEEMADALWDASRACEPAVLTVMCNGLLINFRLGIRSVEVTKHGPTKWRNGQQFTVALELFQLVDAPQTAS